MDRLGGPGTFLKARLLILNSPVNYYERQMSGEVKWPGRPQVGHAAKLQNYKDSVGPDGILVTRPQVSQSCSGITLQLEGGWGKSHCQVKQ